MGIDQFSHFHLSGDCVEMTVKKNCITATVQIPDYEPVDVLMSQNCSTLGEYASFLLEKINQSNGNLIGLDLPGAVQLYAIFLDKSAVIDHDIQLQLDVKYTFRFKLVDGVVEEQKNDGLIKQVEELAIHMAQLANEKDKFKELMKVQVQKLEALEKLRVEEQKKRLSPEFAYAHLIGFPIVTNLEENYNKKYFLELIKHGNAITPNLCVQSKQKLVDGGIIKSIVNLLATTKKPENLIGKVIIEDHYDWFKWPENGELKLKQKNTNVVTTYNGATAKPTTLSGLSSAEYELLNKGCRFQVLIFYESEENFNKAFLKFAYRRLP